jgi:hypothetical protein
MSLLPATSAKPAVTQTVAPTGGAKAVSRTGDPKILVGATALGTSSLFIVRRYNADGSVDATAAQRQK